MNQNGLESQTLKDNTTDMYIGFTISFIFKRCSKLLIDQSCNGTMRCDKLLGHTLKIF